MDEIGRSSSLLKKAHHFFLRAVRCHLVIYFRVYPKITYQLPSLWPVFSAIAPHYVCGHRWLPLSVVPSRPPFFSMVKVATRARNFPFWPSLWHLFSRSLPQQTSLTELTCDHYQCAVSFIYFWLWSLSHHVCDDHRCIYNFIFFIFTLLLYYIFFALSSNLFI